MYFGTVFNFAFVHHFAIDLVNEGGVLYVTCALNLIARLSDTINTCQQQTKSSGENHKFLFSL